MSAKVGYKGKVAKGSDTIIGMGNWSIDGFSRQELDATAFGDDAEKFEWGIMSGGTISFAGYHDPDDTTGQLVLVEAHDAATDLTDMRFYIDNTSYYEACQTTGYLHPGKTTGANTQLSHINITSNPISYDKGSLGSISFNAKVSGHMVLV